MLGLSHQSYGVHEDFLKRNMAWSGPVNTAVSSVGVGKASKCISSRSTPHSALGFGMSSSDVTFVSEELRNVMKKAITFCRDR